ncbi:MAG: hypothetical protein K2H90_03790 [Oscillospiraceae bacterium]|nr:hypothetical protein [Oscillospiraceae bacterium]
MRFNLKKELREAFTPPEPNGRDGFLAAIPYPKLTYREFVLSQICYIRKRIWFVSLLILLAGVGAVYIVPDSSMVLVWIISALIPLLAVLTAAEISRSDIFGMFEIEAVCRFALPQVIGARMIILGICNFAVIAAATAVLGIFSPLGIAKSALYILTPYVSVNGISLAIFGRVNGQDGVYLSVAAAFAVSLAGVILFGKELYDERMTNVLMMAVCVAGTVLMTVQIKKLLVGKDNYYGIKD